MNRIKALVYVVLLCFIGLCITAFFLYQNMNEVRELHSHKDVLIKRLSEEVYYSKKLRKENDSLIREIGGHNQNLDGSGLYVRD